MRRGRRRRRAGVGRLDVRRFGARRRVTSEATKGKGDETRYLDPNQDVDRRLYRVAVARWLKLGFASEGIRIRSGSLIKTSKLTDELLTQIDVKHVLRTSGRTPSRWPRTSSPGKRGRLSYDLHANVKTANSSSEYQTRSSEAQRVTGTERTLKPRRANTGDIVAKTGNTKKLHPGPPIHFAEREIVYLKLQPSSVSSAELFVQAWALLNMYRSTDDATSSVLLYISVSDCTESAVRANLFDAIL
ncbi:hypothetical protein EVAR_40349_1 [Eumeta japonica]|uniref:Uncharacterized protein n=1 Tax=Eumeta variegata TaxID=151549 RepID=A0A4C1XNG6_EUMVA|nr:hypothetical protein EVAR_40349_1 [Eumeta japonica]